MIECERVISISNEGIQMISSNDRKKALSKWLKDNNPNAFYSALKLQKFLFFYEVFCKVSNESFDFSKLQGFVNGPVFGTVYGDYVHEHSAFIQAIDQVETDLVNEKIAKMASFLVSCKSEKDLSNISHLFNIWRSKEDEILKREGTVILNERDFNDFDAEQAKLAMAFAEDYINDDYTLITIGNRIFLSDKETYRELTPNHFDILCDVAENTYEEDGLDNPIFLSIEEGEIILE